MLPIFLQFLIFLPTISGFVPPWMFMGRPLTGFRQIDTIDLLDAPEAEWFDQYLDHFNSKNGIKWRQELFRQKISVSTLCENLRNPYGIDSDGVFNYFDSALFVANITKYLHPDYNKVDISYADMISYLQQNNSDDPVQASTRTWTWQVCKEFGNFITTTGGKIAFGSHVSQNFYVGVCIDVFGKDHSITKTQAGMHLNRKHFGNSLNYNATNVIAARGSDDPWGLLTLTESNNPTISIYSINGTGHCGDMAPPSKNDSDSLKQFRTDVMKKIKEWIKEDDF